jgi:hypothetical protein
MLARSGMHAVAAFTKVLIDSHLRVHLRDQATVTPSRAATVGAHLLAQCRHLLASNTLIWKRPLASNTLIVFKFCLSAVLV